MGVCDFNIVVEEHVIEATELVDEWDIRVLEDEIRIGCISGSGEGQYLIDHDGDLILDHDGNKIPI